VHEVCGVNIQGRSKGIIASTAKQDQRLERHDKKLLICFLHMAARGNVLFVHWHGCASCWSWRTPWLEVFHVAFCTLFLFRRKMRPRTSSRCYQCLVCSSLRLPSAGDRTIGQTREPHFPQAPRHLSQRLLRPNYSSDDETGGPRRLRQQLPAAYRRFTRSLRAWSF